MIDADSRILVTGATGLIGRRVVEQLGRFSAQVIAADSRSLNLLDPAAVEPFMARVRPTHLIHLAWYAEHGKFWTSPLNLDWVAASLRLFQSFAALGGRRAVITGSCAEYDWRHPHLTEDASPTNPGTLYGVCKNALRQIVEKYAGQTGVSLAWARIFFLYGPDEHPNRLIPSILRPLLAGRTAVVRSGGHVRNLMHVDDIAAALIAVLGSDLTGPVNIAGPDAISLGGVAELLGELTGRPDLLRIEQADGTPENPKVLTGDTARLSSVGFAPRVGLRQGLNALIGPATASTASS